MAKKPILGTAGESLIGSLPFTKDNKSASPLIKEQTAIRDNQILAHYRRGLSPSSIALEMGLSGKLVYGRLVKIFDRERCRSQQLMDLEVMTQVERLDYLYLLNLREFEKSCGPTGHTITLTTGYGDPAAATTDDLPLISKAVKPPKTTTVTKTAIGVGSVAYLREMRAILDARLHLFGMKSPEAMQVYLEQNNYVSIDSKESEYAQEIAYTPEYLKQVADAAKEIQATSKARMVEAPRSADEVIEAEFSDEVKGIYILMNPPDENPVGDNTKLPEPSQE